jgi:hypothetical protein
MTGSVLAQSANLGPCWTHKAFTLGLTILKYAYNFAGWPPACCKAAADVHSRVFQPRLLVGMKVTVTKGLSFQIWTTHTHTAAPRTRCMDRV